MAILRIGILGGISGKVGPVIGARIFGRDTVKSLSSSKKTNSPAQIISQNKFKNIMIFCKQILVSIINYLWVNRSMQMSNINNFIKINYDNFDNEGLPTAAIIMTKEIGIVASPVFDAVTYNNSTGELYVALEDDEEPEAQPDDILDVIIFQKSKNFQVDYIPYFMQRSEQSSTATIPTGYDDTDLILFCWFRRGNPGDSGFQISNSNGRFIN